ncbi:MAG: hypothetical protein ACRER2_05685 [Methylococcales bacterium]
MNRIQRFRDAVAELEANYLAVYDYRPVTHFMAAKTVVDGVTLVVDKDGDFWWEGYYEGTGIRWETGAMPFKVLEEPLDTERDFRKFIDDNDTVERD